MTARARQLFCAVCGQHKPPEEHRQHTACRQVVTRHPNGRAEPYRFCVYCGGGMPDAPTRRFTHVSCQVQQPGGKPW